MVEFPACALGKLAVGGDLSVTRVERSVTLDPNEALPRPGVRRAGCPYRYS
jgi:hypothetical protein